MKQMESEVPKHKQRPKGGSQLRLAWKGVILIGVPIAFELIFVGAMSAILMQVDHERAIELHQRNIAFNASKLLNVYIQTGFVMSGEKSMRTWRIVEAGFAEAAHTMKVLHQLCENDPEALAHLTRVDQNRRKVDSFVERGSLILMGGRTPNDIGDALSGRDKLMPVLIGIAHKMQKVVDDAEEREFLSPEKQASLRQRQGQILIIGLAANILVSVLLALFFTRDVTSRLTILADNADRLAKEKELNPQLAGNDEIAQLDRVFHVTAMALDEARHKERAVFDNSQDVIGTINGEYVFSSMNPASEKVFGYTPEEMRSKTILDLTLAEDKESTEKTLHSDFGPQRRLAFENRVTKKDGSMIYVHWSASRNTEDSTVYLIAHDISKRKELEQLKQDFLAVVSHDLRTPLTSITGIAKLIVAGAFGKVEEKPLTVLQGINKSADKLLELINDLLDIEKLESGHMQLVLEPVKLKEIVEKSSASAPEGSQVRLEFFGDKPDIEIVADKDRLTQALGNILDHAVTSSSPGAPVRFMARNTDGAIEIQIIDTAPTMEEKARNQLFDRFKDMSAMQSANAEDRGGTGLALPIARKIIESHNGTVSILPQGSSGNIYYIHLPFMQMPAKAEPNAV